MSNKSERDILLRHGIRPHKNSGRGMVKGDGSDQEFVWDVKEAAKSFTLNDKVWSKICTDAYKVDKYKNPALLVVLGGTSELAIIEVSALKALMKKIEMLENLLEVLE